VPLNPSEALPKTLAGTVRPQWVRCGRRNCRCRRGLLHGPYFARFWRQDGKLRKQYVKRDAVASVRAMCEARRQQERERAAAVNDWRAMVSVVKEAEKLCQD
jgi:hypothetical protein